MKILFDHHDPFLLAHGGFQIQIQETRCALEELGVEVDHLRWWDEEQTGDIIHFFGRPTGQYLDLAHGKKLRVVIAELLTGLGARSTAAIACQSSLIELTKRFLPAPFWAKMGWDAYTKADRIIALTQWEAELMQRVFRASASRISIVPNGVNEHFLAPIDLARGRETFLVCTATIAERKRVLELAQAAVQARIPLWIVGQPYAASDGYARKFDEFARTNADLIRYEGPVRDRNRLAQIYRRARGFVLLSIMESLSLSALEAAACGCPLLLSDLPWAHATFGSDASYCPIASTPQTAECLRTFYDAAPQLKQSFKPASWRDVASKLKTIYEDVLKTSR